MSLSSNFPAIKPSLNLDFANTKRLDPRVTFTRSTTGTYYDGVTTAMAEQNLLRHSQEFDNAAWSGGAIVTANSDTAPDGTATADTLNPTSGANSNKAQQASTSTTGTYTASVYARVTSGTGKLYLSLLDGGWGPSTITTCSLTTTWQRFTVSRTLTAGNTWFVVIGQTDASTDATTSIIWGAQLEQRSSVTAYTATTTQPITNYIPVMLTAAANVPRFDHNPTTDESLGLLIEEQRTNLLTYSAQFDNAAWVAQSVAVTANAGVAPDGTTTADKLAADSTSSPHALYNASALTLTAAVYTWSIFVKAAGNNFANLTAVSPNGGNRYAIAVDLTSGTVTQTASSGTPTNTSSFVSSYGNGWYRIGISMTASSNASASYFVVMGIPTGTPTRDSSSLDPLYTGNGFNGIFIWGAQLEAGGFATSYIATTAASATRNADAASMTGTNFSSWFNSGEGSLFASSDLAGSSSLGMIAELGDGTYNNRTTLFADQYAVSAYLIQVGGVNQVAITNAVTFNVPFRLAAAYKVNDFAASQNGAAVQTDTSGTVPTVTALYLGYQGGGGGVLNGHIQRFTYYPARLTNAQLQALTS